MNQIGVIGIFLGVVVGVFTTIVVLRGGLGHTDVICAYIFASAIMIAAGLIATAIENRR